MSVEYRKGDIFTTELKNIGHGCNCIGSMGAGIALQVVKRHPELLPEYQRICKEKLFTPGIAYFYPIPNTDKSIVNLATQYLPGANAKLDWIKQSLVFAISHFGLTDLALPRIGAGIGGLKWEDVKAVIEEVSVQFPSTRIVVYEL